MTQCETPWLALSSGDLKKRLFTWNGGPRIGKGAVEPSVVSQPAYWSCLQAGKSLPSLHALLRSSWPCAIHMRVIQAITALCYSDACIWPRGNRVPPRTESQNSHCQLCLAWSP